MNARLFVLLFLIFTILFILIIFFAPVSAWLQAKWDKAQKRLRKKLRV
jgi:hypothetical protein